MLKSDDRRVVGTQIIRVKYDGVSTLITKKEISLDRPSRPPITGCPAAPIERRRSFPCVLRYNSNATNMGKLCFPFFRFAEINTYEGRPIIPYNIIYAWRYRRFGRGARRSETVTSERRSRLRLETGPKYSCTRTINGTRRQRGE